MVKQKASPLRTWSPWVNGSESGLSLNAGIVFLPTSVTMNKSVHLCEPAFPHRGQKCYESLARHLVNRTPLITCSMQTRTAAL